MKRKFLILLLPLLSLAAFATPGVAPETQRQDPVLMGETVGEQYVAEPSMVPSEEVSYVLESEEARKMKQAEKMHNAEVYDSYGGGLTIIAMCIVIGALIVLSVLFFIFGSISSGFLKRKKRKATKSIAPEGDAPAADSTPDTGDVIAAISAALAQHFAADHDMQDTILTIRKLRKAYSPWNSKIYNMRHLPEVHHNPPTK